MANFNSMGLKLHIPADMLSENLVIRALHLKFDHLSETAKSFNQLLPVACHSFYTDNLDLPNSLLQEWSLQVEMQKNKFNELKQKCLEYESLKQEYMEQLEKQKQRSKDENHTRKKFKSTKMPKQPLCLEGDMMPDIYEEFLREEQKNYENFTNSIFRPELLNLSYDEVNLRKYTILGGIYQVYYVRKPLHTHFNSFNMTWHKNDSKLQIQTDLTIEPNYNADSRKSRMSKRFTKRMSVKDLDKRLDETDVNCPWFILTFELPEHLCHWGSPIVCHFEETTQSMKTVDHKHIVNITEPVAVSEPQQRNPLVDLENVFATRTKSIEIKDFSLLDILRKPQIRQIERHILPRIISSFKFPKEVNEEDVDHLSNRPKKGRLLRQKTDEASQQFQNKRFNFNSRQNNPERLYTIYSEVEPIEIISLLKELNIADHEEPETFAQLLQIVEYIKKKCQSNVNNILELRPLKQKTATHNKRIKQFLKLKGRTSSKAATTVASVAKKESAPKSAETKIQFKSSEFSLNNLQENEQLIGKEIQNDEENKLFLKNQHSVIPDDELNEAENEVMKYSHWTTKYIFKSHFDAKNRTVVIQTDRLGNFGFAFKRYEHFPFKYWAMAPNENDPDNEVVFTLDTQYVRCVLLITPDGIRGYVTEPTKTFVRYPKMYLEIKEPLKDFKKFKQLFKEKHLNIFAENDAGFYIENGYFSEKHLPNELHTYNCMAVHSTQMSFDFSLWNRLAKRRDIILKFRQHQDLKDNLVEVLITPGEAYFVEIQELCSADLNVINLDYNLTWRNIEPYSDLHHLIVSMYPAATDLRCKNAQLMCFVKELLSEIRPLSFS